MSEFRRVSLRGARRRRWVLPLTCWLGNRWNWRRKRRVRAHLHAARAVAVPLLALPVDLDVDVQRLAEMAESLGHSRVLDLGYGSGEAVLVAHRLEPLRLRPYIDRACGFTDAELSGTPEETNVLSAIDARNELLREVREILVPHSKLAPLRL